MAIKQPNNIAAENKITQEQIDKFLVLEPQFQAIYHEMKDLSTKKPEMIVSKFKMNIINSLITSARDILEKEDSFYYLNKFNDDDLPQNSDVVLLLSQYKTALHNFSERYNYSATGNYHDKTWHLNPKKLLG